MGARKLSPFEASQAELILRIADLEHRVRLLEAKVRQVASLAAEKEGRPEGRAQPKGGLARCPGCCLELPRGRKRDSCVWCGFVFESMPAKAPRGR
jgi:hypothetical protein